MFLDVEASSFDDDSYPIELAWSDDRGEIQRFLIRPLDGWDNWNEASEAIHGIERGGQRNGWPADYVAERFTSDVRGEPSTPMHLSSPKMDRSIVRCSGALCHAGLSILMNCLSVICVSPAN